MAFRSTLLAAAALLPSIAACGGDDGGQPVPEGTHYHFVANKVSVPTSNAQIKEYGLDLNNDGTKDNQLGSVLSLLGSMGLDIQTTIDTAVAEGSIILLTDFQTKDFTNSGAAGIQVFLGSNPTPAACNADEMYDETTMKGCGHHLDGSGMFSIASDSPTNAALGGKIVNGTFNGGPGNLSLQIALGGTDAIDLDLIGARAQVSGVSETGITSAILAGAVTKEDIDTGVIPAVATQLKPIIERDCPTPDVEGCGCTGTGATIIGLLDTDMNCDITVEEIKTNPIIMGVLAPDVTIDGKMALSLGIKATAVKATYTVAGQQ